MTRKHATALLAGGALLGAMQSPASAQTPVTLRIGVSPIEPAAEVYYAKDMGFFAKAGLDVEIQSMQGSSLIVAAIVGNTIDIGFDTLDTLAAQHLKGIPLVIIAPTHDYVSPATIRTQALVVTANSPIQQAKDLNGKTIAVSTLHSLADLGARVWIDQNGGDSTTVKFTEIPFPAIPGALDAGRVDAAWVVEPFVTVARKNDRVLFYGFDGIAKHFIVGAWVATQQWANDHADAVRRFAAVIHDTAVWANKNPQLSADILAKYVKIDPAVIATMARNHYAEQLTPALMQPLIDAAAKYNAFKTFPAQELIFKPS
ncbi:MAG TPA: ABC transporter substrate-binding protein [Candidatus Lustribacter sp.]|nr:ABC transporter substrate-binding protein [Candidatus Lustribacter sp.]